jgi:hypothetical protein
MKTKIDTIHSLQNLKELYSCLYYLSLKKLVAMFPKCHICGKSGVYTEMKDYLIYSVHPKCERGLLSLSLSSKEFQTCSLCKKTLLLSKDEFKTHLVNYHSKEALADLIINGVIKI